MFGANVYNYGPGASQEDQALAASAMGHQPYMGFMTRRPQVFNFQATPPGDYQKFGTLTPGKIPQPQKQAQRTPYQDPMVGLLQNRLAREQLRKQITDLKPTPQAPTTPAPVSTPTPYTPSPAPEAPKFELPPLNLPQTPQFGGIGTNYGGGIGSNMQVSTGIQSGLLPQSAIDTAVSAAKAPAAAPAMPNVSGAQASALSQLFQDGLGQAQSQNAVDLGRSGSYEQAQMLNAMQKAQASAGLDWANLGTRFQETAQSAQQPYRSFLWNLLGSIA